MSAAPPPAAPGRTQGARSVPAWLRLLGLSRETHRWAGIAVGAFVVVLGATGLWLVHEKQLDGVGRWRVPLGSQPPEPLRPVLSADGAVMAALGREGLLVNRGAGWEPLPLGGPIDKLEAVALGTAAIYVGHGRGLLRCGAAVPCEEIGAGLPGQGDGRRPVKAVALPPGGGVVAAVERTGVFASSDGGATWVRVAELPVAPPTSGIELRKLLKDLHTGALFGHRLWPLYDLTALALVFFVVSGLYLYLAPALVRRRKAKTSAVPSFSSVTSRPSARRR